MGNSNSTEDRKGLRITRISPQSPASKTDLQAYTDFILAIHDADKSFSLETDFYKYIIDNENKTLVLVIYNILTKKQRYIELLPTREWPGADFLLGFKVRYESVTNAEANMYRISKVVEPNLKHELQALYDFFIAVNEFEYSDINDLKRKLSLYQRCELVIYNIEDGDVRNVKVNYDRKSGLGFEIAQGYLHDLSYLYGLKMLEKAKLKDIEVISRGHEETNNQGFREVEMTNLRSNEQEEHIKETKTHIKEDEADMTQGHTETIEDKNLTFNSNSQSENGPIIPATNENTLSTPIAKKDDSNLTEEQRANEIVKNMSIKDNDQGDDKNPSDSKTAQQNDLASKTPNRDDNTKESDDTIQPEPNN